MYSKKLKLFIHPISLQIHPFFFFNKLHTQNYQNTFLIKLITKKKDHRPLKRKNKSKIICTKRF